MALSDELKKVKDWVKREGALVSATFNRDYEAIANHVNMHMPDKPAAAVTPADAKTMMEHPDEPAPPLTLREGG